MFFASGTPSGLGFEAGVVIDETKRYEAALWLSESIKDTFVKAHIAELDITDVIQIVNSLMEHNVPSPKDDVLRFEEIDLYASQGGCVLGNVEYPPGFVLQGTMFLCGKKAASVDCRIGKQGLKLYGEIPGFKVGPLTITGATGDNAIVDMEITKTRQHFEVNGKIVLWGISASILVIAELQPHPQFIFDFELAWSDLLKFKVYAEMIRGAEDTDLKNLENSDFVMRATMHQKILSAVADQMQHFFEEAHHAAKEGIAAARKRVIDAKKAFDEKIDAIKADVEMTRAAYKSRVAQVEQDFRIKEEECNLKRISLEREVISAESHANKLVADANTNLDQKELEMNQKVQEAKTSLADKEREGDQEIGGAIQTLQQKRVDLQNGFGNAIDAIRRAEERVNQEECRRSYFWMCVYKLICIL